MALESRGSLIRVVVHQLEEPHRLGRGLHLRDHLRPRGCVRRRRRREVDDRDNANSAAAAARGRYLWPVLAVVAEYGGDGRDAGVHEALAADLGVIERLQLAQAVVAVATSGFFRGGHGCRPAGPAIEASWMD